MTKSGKILIGNGRLITRDPLRPFLKNGALVIDANHIEEVGETQVLLQKYPGSDYIDAQGMFIMPGYINAHHHIYSAFARGMSIPDNHPQNFLEILEGTWWNLDRHMTLEETYNSGIAAYLECIRNGVTTLIDHHASYKEVTGSLYALEKAAALTGVRTCLSYEISDRDGKEKMLQAVEESFDFAESLENSTMIETLIGLHASFTLSDETLKICKERNSRKIGYHVHVAEGLYDQEHSLKEYGCSVVERLKRFDILNENTLAGHCVHISKEDMDILKESGVTVIHNPQSNMANAVGVPDVLRMIDKGITVCLGTDGYTFDMLESAKAALVLQKHQSGNPDRGFAETSAMLFENNARIASKIFGETLGIIKEGAAADVIIVDYRPYTPLNESNIDGHLFFGITGNHTDTTIINGKVLMRHKKMMADTENLSAKCVESAAELWRKLYE
ncbi:putative aminohydrolase SsnA [Eubacteriaceae bacterium ES3]|nr:putative aminohydrolase SsnA [Eubacteriaceae bacterium ES3]